MIKISAHSKKIKSDDWYWQEMLNCRKLKNQKNESEKIKTSLNGKNPESDGKNPESNAKNLESDAKNPKKELTTEQTTFLQTEPVKTFLAYITDIPTKDFCHLLTVSIDEMPGEAPDLFQSIRPYWDFCRWYIKIKQELNNAGRSRKKRKETIVSGGVTMNLSHLQEWKKSFESSFRIDPDSIAPLLYITKLGEAVDAVNLAVGKEINYDFIPSEVRRKIVYSKDVKVCPYCNQSYVYSLSYLEEETADSYQQYLGDLDHFLPKSIFCLFSMSLWNLIPCCKSCNQLFKKADTIELLNPLTEGFEEDCHLELHWNKNLNVDMFTEGSPVKALEVSWEISPDQDLELSEDKKNRILNSIQTFRLNTQYSGHSEIIMDVLRKKALWNSSYLETVEEFANKIGMLEMTGEEYNRLLYGVSLNPENDQYEIHGKMIRDLINWN